MQTAALIALFALSAAVYFCPPSLQLRASTGRLLAQFNRKPRNAGELAKAMQAERDAIKRHTKKLVELAALGEQLAAQTDAHGAAIRELLQ